MPADRRFPSRRSVRLYMRPPPNYKESSPEEEDDDSSQQDSIPAASQTNSTITAPPPASMTPPPTSMAPTPTSMASPRTSIAAPPASIAAPPASMTLPPASTTRSSPPASASTSAGLSSNEHEHEDKFGAALACFVETQFGADVVSIRNRCLDICNAAAAAWKALTVAEQEHYFDAAKSKQAKESRERSSVAQDDGRVARSPTPPMLMPDWSDPQSRTIVEEVYGLEEAQRLEGSVSMHAPPHQSKLLVGGSRTTRSQSLSDLPNPPPGTTAMTTTWSDAGYRGAVGQHFPAMSGNDVDWFSSVHQSNSLVGSARPAKTHSLPDVFTQAAESSSSATVGNATLALSEQSFPAASNDTFAQGSDSGWTITPGDIQYKPPSRANSHSRRRGDDYIPRPPNSFMLFRSKYWEEQKANPSERDHRQVSRAAANAWHELPEGGRDYYRQLADRVKADHQRQYPGYKFRPEHHKRGVAAKPRK